MVKQGYKSTSVGIIPTDWEVKTLGEIIDSTQLGGNYQNDEIERQYPLIKMGNLNRGFINTDKILHINQGITPAKQDKLVFGDLLFNTRNTLELVGKVAIWRNELAIAYFNSNIMRISFNQKYVGSNFYMNLILNTSKSILQLKAIATGTTSVSAIYSRDLIKIEIPIPPLAEQVLIAKALSDTDELITNLESLILKKQLIKQGTMQQLLQPKHDWEVKRLGEIGKCYRGVTYNPEKDLRFYDDNKTIRLLRSNNIQNSKLNFNSLQFVDSNRVKPNQILEQNDIIICMANGSKQLVGKSALFSLRDNMNYTFGAFMGCFRVNTNIASNGFILLNFQTFSYRNYIEILLSGSSINNLNSKDIESIEIPFPPLAEQTRIATILSDMDNEITLLESKLHKYRNIKQGMMQSLLTGQIRLV